MDDMDRKSRAARRRQTASLNRASLGGIEKDPSPLFGLAWSIGKWSRWLAKRTPAAQGTCHGNIGRSYSRERLALDLALRFLRYEAHTQTIRAGRATATTVGGSCSVQVARSLTV